MQSPSAVQLAELGYQADLETCWHLRMESGSLAKGPVVAFTLPYPHFFCKPLGPLPHVPDHPALIPDAKMSTISYVVAFCEYIIF